MTGGSEVDISGGDAFFQPEQPEQSEQSEQREQSEQSEQPEQREQSEQSEQPEQYEQPEQPEQRKQSEQLMQSSQSFRLASAMRAASSLPKYSTEHLLPRSSLIHVSAIVCAPQMKRHRKRRLRQFFSRLHVPDGSCKLDHLAVRQGTDQRGDFVEGLAFWLPDRDRDWADRSPDGRHDAIVLRLSVHV